MHFLQFSMDLLLTPKTFLCHHTLITEYFSVFQFHVQQGFSAFCLMLVVYLGVSGTRSRRYIPISYFPTNVHSGMGFIVLFLFLVQFLCGIWRNVKFYKDVTRYIHAILAWPVQMVGSKHFLKFCPATSKC